MPTNLPPEYFSVEREYREAKSVDEKVRLLEELISTIPKHKGTDKLRADYRSKLAKLKDSVTAGKKTGKHLSHFHIEKEGAAGRVVVVGCTNTGKSSLITKLTNASPEISESPYSTWTPTPGIMLYENVHIQLIDTPPIERDFIEPEFIELIKSADVLLILIDLYANSIEQFQIAVDALNKHRIFSNHQTPDLIDKRPYFLPILIAANKNETDQTNEDFDVLNELLRDTWFLVSISIKQEKNLELLKETLFREMKIIRVFSKPPGKDADLTQPFILKTGSRIDDFAAKVHKDFHEKLKIARLWGKNVFDGQCVGRDHILNDGDIVELHI